MRPRDIAQKHRSSTPLELLFDLVFVVAVSRAVKGLVTQVQAGELGRGLMVFMMVFLAIWWAWANFAWFASAYDVDDGPYRLLVMLQMAGVLVLAAGVDSLGRTANLKVITIGYAIMRLALAIQWLRAGRGHPAGRATTRRYAIGISVLQVGWVARLALPETTTWNMVSFGLMGLMELAVPVIAERARRTNWHPHHIAERYSLFVIILLGESVLAAVSGLRNDVPLFDRDWGSITVAACSLILLFALWWIYFLVPVGDGLIKRRHIAFRWSYVHALVFFALALLGAGLDLAVSVAESTPGNISAFGSCTVLAIAVGLFMVGWWLQSSVARGWWGLRTHLGVTLGALALSPVVALTPAGMVGGAVAVTAVTCCSTAWLVLLHERFIKLTG